MQMEAWRVGWARDGDTIAQVHAPGHDRPRCVYADFLNTGPAVSRTLRARLNRMDGVRRVSDLIVSDIVVQDGRAVGAVALHLESGEPVVIAAGSPPCIVDDHRVGTFADAGDMTGDQLEQCFGAHARPQDSSTA